MARVNVRSWTVSVLWFKAVERRGTEGQQGASVSWSVHEKAGGEASSSARSSCALFSFFVFLFLRPHCWRSAPAAFFTPPPRQPLKSDSQQGYRMRSPHVLDTNVPLPSKADATRHCEGGMAIHTDSKRNTLRIIIKKTFTSVVRADQTRTQKDGSW